MSAGGERHSSDSLSYNELLDENKLLKQNIEKNHSKALFIINNFKWLNGWEIIELKEDRYYISFNKAYSSKEELIINSGFYVDYSLEPVESQKAIKRIIAEAGTAILGCSSLLDAYYRLLLHLRPELNPNLIQKNDSEIIPLESY